MLQVFFDESRVGSSPLYVLAGWVADAETWASFVEAWDKVLRMKPRIAYFKYAEARNFSGEFEGISEESRREKLNLLAQTIDEHNLLGVCSLMHHDAWEMIRTKLDGPLKSPYVWLAFSAYSTLLSHASSLGETEKILTYFDALPGQSERVWNWWPEFIETIREIAPGAEALIAAHPYFVDDKNRIPIQAADLHSGWRWEIETAAMADIDPRPTMWLNTYGAKWRSLGAILNESVFEKAINKAGPRPA